MHFVQHTSGLLTIVQENYSIMMRKSLEVSADRGKIIVISEKKAYVSVSYMAVIPDLEFLHLTCIEYFV